MIKYHIPGLDKLVLQGGKGMEAVFKFNYLSSAGTAILVAALLSAGLLRLSARETGRTFLDTLKALKFPIITTMSVLGFAYIANFAGLSNTLGQAMAKTGAFFPFFAPVLGWMGVFITGSDTSANALFAKLQQVTSTKIGVDPVVAVAANTSGGGTGKMISPLSIAVAAGAVGLVGRESDLFRFTFKHSVIFVILMGVFTTLQAYVFTWMIPAYQVAETKAVAAAAQVNIQPGLLYLAIAGALVILTIIAVVISNQRKLRSVRQ